MDTPNDEAPFETEAASQSVASVEVETTFPEASTVQHEEDDYFAKAPSIAMEESTSLNSTILLDHHDPEPHTAAQDPERSSINDQLQGQTIAMEESSSLTESTVAGQQSAADALDNAVLHIDPPGTASPEKAEPDTQDSACLAAVDNISFSSGDRPVFAAAEQDGAELVAAVSEEGVGGRKRSQTVSQGDWSDVVASVVDDTQSRPRSKTSTSVAWPGPVPQAGVPAQIASPPERQASSAATVQPASPTAHAVPAAVSSIPTAPALPADQPSPPPAQSSAASRRSSGSLPAPGEPGAVPLHPALQVSPPHSPTPPAADPPRSNISDSVPQSPAGPASSETATEHSPHRGVSRTESVSIDLETEVTVDVPLGQTAEVSGSGSAAAGTGEQAGLESVLEPGEWPDTPEERAAAEQRFSAWPGEAGAGRGSEGAGTATGMPDQPRVLHGTPLDRIAEVATLNNVSADMRQQAFAHDTNQPADLPAITACVQRRAWRAVLMLTNVHLTALGQGLRDNPSAVAAPHVTSRTTTARPAFQVWLCRVAAFVRLRMYREAQDELATFGSFDRPEYYYEKQPDLYPGRRGSMVPFTLRLTHAELPSFTSGGREAIDRLGHLLRVCQTVLQRLRAGLNEYGDGTCAESEAGKITAIWTRREARVLHSLAGVYSSLKCFPLAAATISTLLLQTPGDLALLSAMGRLMLQAGDYTAASEYFAQVTEGAAATGLDHGALLQMNEGVLAMARNAHDTASRHFRKVLEYEPGHLAAACNLGVSLLYRGTLKEAVVAQLKAVKFYEGLLSGDGPVCDTMVLNLCSLYEIESSSSAAKKRAVLELVISRVHDDFNADAFKLDTKPT